MKNLLGYSFCSMRVSALGALKALDVFGALAP